MTPSLFQLAVLKIHEIEQGAARGLTVSNTARCRSRAT